MSKKLIPLLIIVSALIIFLPKTASADVGPKPTVDIDVVYNQQSIPDLSFSAKMLSCGPQNAAENQPKFEENELIPQLRISEYDSSKNCYWSPTWFAWGGQCSNSSCRFDYFPPDKFKLAVFIPSLNKVFITNEISRTNFNSRYKAELFPDGSAKISETTSVSDKASSFTKTFITTTSGQLLPFAGALILTIILELLASLIFVSIRKLPKKILAYVLLANIISLPIVWFLFPLIKFPAIGIIVVSEIFAILFESWFIYFLGKKIISFKQSFILSIINNLVSLVIGGLIFMSLSASNVFFI